MVLKGKTILLH